MNCYGYYRGLYEKCQTCQLAQYCKEAKEPPLLGNRMTAYNDRFIVPQTEEPYRSYQLEPPPDESPQIYNRNDMLELIVFMANLDTLTLDYLSMFLADPHITFQKMADQKAVSRQAVHKYLKHQCKKIPELADLLKIGERRKINKTNRTFMEEVCRIRRKTSVLSLKKPKNASLCWRKLICLNPSSNSFSTSILKGAKLWRNDSSSWDNGL